MKKIILVLLFAFACGLGFGQDMKRIDSLKHVLAMVKSDTGKTLAMAEIAAGYGYLDADSSLFYCNRSLALATKIKFIKGEIAALTTRAGTLGILGDIPGEFQLYFRSLQLAQDNHDIYGTAQSFTGIGDCYWNLEDYPKAINYYKSSMRVAEKTLNSPWAKDYKIYQESDIAISYLFMNKLDSTLFYMRAIQKATMNEAPDPMTLLISGELFFKMGDHKKAFSYLRQSIYLSEKLNSQFVTGFACKVIAGFYKDVNQPDSAIFYAKKGLSNSRNNFKVDVLADAKLLADVYEGKDINQAHAYLKLAMSLNEELYGAKKVRELQKILSEQEEKQRKIELEHVAYQGLLKEYAFLAGLAIMLLVAFILYRNSQREKKANILLEEKNHIIEQTLTDLKAAQAQLVQSEKMASLGELTAGIAHEIQNPLNFVNNFSEVNAELISEMKQEIDKGDLEEIKTLAIDIEENSKKINMHGKRADGIVKGMLQHSQLGSGTKEPTNINNLAEEYMRLAYQGLRAKDKNFNAEMSTHLDPNQPKLKVIPQDIGRVLLNLFNNAFYAVNEKQKTAKPDYKPEVSVTTFAENGQVIIKVKDNGVGIPDAIKDKIMQPFFTTKPTGEGTGLGLSLTYDMVVKGHGGSLEVESEEGEGSVFIVQLPVN